MGSVTGDLIYPSLAIDEAFDLLLPTALCDDKRCGDGQAHLVAQPLARDDCNFIAYPLVRLEVEGEFGVVAFDDDLGRLLDRLCANATHVGGVVELKAMVSCFRSG